MKRGRKPEKSEKLGRIADDIVEYIVSNDYTIREVAELIGISKTTLHSYLHSDAFRHKVGDNNYDLVHETLEEHKNDRKYAIICPKY